MILLPPSIIDAIHSLVPDAQIRISGDNIVWNSPAIAPVTREEITQELARLTELYQTNNYQRKRVEEYPSIGDQLDALFHAGAFPADMAAKIQDIKDKHPKPEGV